MIQEFELTIYQYRNEGTNEPLTSKIYATSDADWMDEDYAYIVHDRVKVAVDFDISFPDDNNRAYEKLRHITDVMEDITWRLKLNEIDAKEAEKQLRNLFQK